MRIGIFGGSFDPIHFGHLILAETCREAANLDAVWFVPTWVSPHKQSAPPASPQNRCEMIQLAISGHSGFSLETIEVDRQAVSFTVDTIEALGQRHTGHQFFLLMGADSLVDFPKWKQPDRILQWASLLVVQRHYEPAPNLEAIRTLTNTDGREDAVVPMPAIEISSSEIRDRIRTQRSIRYRTPRAVEKYIQTHGLYDSAD